MRHVDLEVRELSLSCTADGHGGRGHRGVLVGQQSDGAGSGRRLERLVGDLLRKRADLARAIRGPACEQHRRDEQHEHRGCETEDDLWLRPELLWRLLPRLRLAARLEESQADVHALGNSELIEQLRMLGAEALELGCALDGQPP